MYSKLASSKIRPNSLLICLGDFNNAPTKVDRWSVVNSMFTGDKDKNEIENMRRTLLDPLGMHELEQHDYTYQHTDCRARLGRVYTNLHASASITKEVVCKTLRWHDHSDRRPIHFHMRSKRTDHSNLLQEWAVRRPEWPNLVEEHMHGVDHLTNPLTIFPNLSMISVLRAIL